MSVKVKIWLIVYKRTSQRCHLDTLTISTRIDSHIKHRVFILTASSEIVSWCQFKQKHLKHLITPGFTFKGLDMLLRECRERLHLLALKMIKWHSFLFVPWIYLLCSLWCSPLKVWRPLIEHVKKESCQHWKLIVSDWILLCRVSPSRPFRTSALGPLSWSFHDLTCFHSNGLFSHYSLFGLTCTVFVWSGSLVCHALLYTLLFVVFFLLCAGICCEKWRLHK